MSAGRTTGAIIDPSPIPLTTLAESTSRSRNIADNAHPHAN